AVERSTCSLGLDYGGCGRGFVAGRPYRRPAVAWVGAVLSGRRRWNERRLGRVRSGRARTTSGGSVRGVCFPDSRLPAVASHGDEWVLTADRGRGPVPGTGGGRRRECEDGDGRDDRYPGRRDPCPSRISICGHIAGGIRFLPSDSDY